MNSETRIVAEKIAVEVGAIVRCPLCHGHSVSADDATAERRAFAAVTEKWKEGNRAFAGMEHEEVLSHMKGVIRDLDQSCPLNVGALPS